MCRGNKGESEKKIKHYLEALEFVGSFEFMVFLHFW
jgi:hypothetical protein